MNHIPVLKKAIVDQFNCLESPGYFVDGTIGNAGHSLAIVRNLLLSVNNLQLTFIGIDKDQTALELSKKNVKNSGLEDKFIFVHDDFKNIKKILGKLNIEKIDGALIDLGVSSMQLDDKERGFSFQDKDASLDMRMDRTEEFDAKEILNHYTESQLSKVIFDYGEERFAKNIAKNICKTRKDHPLETVGELVEIIEQSIPAKIRYRDGKHFATRTFQALRIEVNKELTGLDSSIKNFVDSLKPGGKLAVLTFHSLEDRIVKNIFKELASSCSCPKNAPVCTCDKKQEIEILTRKPIVPSLEEIDSNPRSRSAKLRVVGKL